MVDQFEELFTLCTDEAERQAFLDLVTGLAEPRSDGAAPLALVVYGIRSDFYTQCAGRPQLRSVLQSGQVLVGPLSETGAREAVLHPAESAGLTVEPGLVELLLRDLGTLPPGGTGPVGAGAAGAHGQAAGRLPLLAHALRATWQQRHGSTLTVEGYRATGGIHRAVANTAERLFVGLDPVGQEIARAVFLRLVRVGNGVDDTRRRLSPGELLGGDEDVDTFSAVVDVFTRGRLLTRGNGTVEITHEALLDAWPRLRGWIDGDRAGRLVRQELEEAAGAWEQSGADRDRLYRGSRLEAAHQWTAAQGSPTGPSVTAFLTASQHQAQRAVRRRRGVVVVLSVLLLIASGTAAVAFDQRSTAQAQREVARTQEAAARQQRALAQRERDSVVQQSVQATADKLRAGRPSLAAQFDLAAYRLKPSDPGARSRLINDVNRPLSRALPGHVGAVTSVAISPDGHILASAGEDLGDADATGQIRLWDLRDPAGPKLLGTPIIVHGGFEDLQFSPNSQTLYAGLSGRGDSTVRLWDVADPAHPLPLGDPLIFSTSILGALALSPDGRILCVGLANGPTRLYDTTTPNHPVSLGSLPGADARPVALTFTPDARILAAAFDNGTVRLWDLSEPARPSPAGAGQHTGSVSSLAFSADGRTLAGAVDAGMQFW
ncbi:WD40 repeat domain-containing protein, partial [Streptomyces sp. H39-S7]|uniref:WD40 repeat domain-containing protein n=1 Tax=Streptomyces sp. H39-S7 TaxID=3004357 RepID=UPI0022C3EB85|nr:hypothetical protein [Streptomyces sp. H39-S7]